MRIIKIILILFFIQLCALCFAKNVRVKILTQYSPKKVILNSFSDNYSVDLGDDKIIKVSEGDVLVINAIGDYCSVSKNGEILGSFSSVYINSMAEKPYFKMQMILPSTKTTFYPDQMSFQSIDSRLNIVNEVELNHYVAGVIESEIGNVKNDELLKVQAVISRTYALKHIDRHKAEGFELCDQVHCQVYHGKARFNSMILPAVDSTHYEVIQDENGDLIEAVFHANCGGQTVNSEEVWSKKRSYLRSVVDTFCITEKQAHWTKEIDKQKWLNYLNTKSGKVGSDVCEFSNDFRLTKLPCYDVSTEDLRDDFKLRSTFFNVRESLDKVVLEGRGFGHGVGMCQEGSIKQAKLGINYKTIIKFYYANIQIVNIDI
jgi:stage II sporulation protein D